VAFVKTIYGNYPPPREDGLPFTQARIDESQEQFGTYDILETFALSPLDADPSHPQGRDFTITTSQFEDSWLKVVWIDANGDLSINDPIDASSEPPTIASVADVRRVLRLGPGQVVSDDDLAYILNVAWSYLSPKLPDFSAANGTETFYEVHAGDVLHLPHDGSSVSAIRGYGDPRGSATILVTGDFDVLPTGVKLWNRGFGLDARYGPFDDTRSRWAKVEIDWERGVAVPYAVREAVALAAAGMYELNPKLIKGMRSERIGSYSYTLSDKDVEGAVPPRVWELLRDYMKRKTVFVT
jgi:hypothetical protein